MSHPKAHSDLQFTLPTGDNDANRQIVNAGAPEADVGQEVPDAVLDQVVGGLARGYAGLAALFPQSGFSP